MSAEPIGRVTAYFARIGVAAIELDSPLLAGDSITIKGATTDFTMVVESMQIDHETVEMAGAGDGVGLLVAERVRPGDLVYKA